MKKRIWELDAARGLALIGMILIHFVFDLTELTGILTWQEPGWFLFLKNHGGALFLVISGRPFPVNECGLCSSERNPCISQFCSFGRIS